MIVLLSGKIGSGKSYCAKYLGTKYGFQRLSFAEALKSDLDALGFDPRKLRLPGGEKPDHLRRLMQVYGEAWREEDPDHWVDILLRKMHLAVAFDNQHPVRYVVDDVRYPNEIDKIVAWGSVNGVDVKTVRLYLVDSDVKTTAINAHHSETALDLYDKWDMYVNAKKGELDKLKSAMDAIVLNHG